VYLPRMAVHMATGEASHQLSYNDRRAVLSVLAELLVNNCSSSGSSSGSSRNDNDDDSKTTTGVIVVAIVVTKMATELDRIIYVDGNPYTKPSCAASAVSTLTCKW